MPIDPADPLPSSGAHQPPLTLADGGSAHIKPTPDFIRGIEAAARWAEDTACGDYLDGPSGERVAAGIRAMAASSALRGEASLEAAAPAPTMQLTIAPTAELATVNGAPCRVWTGVDANGTEVRVWVTVAQPQTHDEIRLAVFEAALRELPAPRTAVSVDMRFVVE